MGDWIGTLRQWQYPAAFRIKAHADEARHGVTIAEAVRSLRRSRLVSFDALEESQREVDVLADRLARLEAAGERSDREVAALIRDVGTGLWRIRRKMIPADGTEPAREMRGLAYALNKAWDSLADRSVEIQDHDGEALSGGEDLNILAFQPTPGLGYEAVIETIKPTIFYKGKKVQTADVIVGTPQVVKS